jgi:RNA polymerase sigma factor (sigma-70 family)
VATEDQANPRAWVEQAVQMHERFLLRYAKSFVRDDATARDVVQDTFLKLCGQTPQSLDGHLLPWLVTVCRRTAIDYLRRSERMNATDLGRDHKGDAPPADASAEQFDESARLRQLIDRLPQRQQEIVRLRFHGGLSYRAIGEVIGITETNVGFLLHTAIKQLRQHIH